MNLSWRFFQFLNLYQNANPILSAPLTRRVSTSVAKTRARPTFLAEPMASAGSHNTDQLATAWMDGEETLKSSATNVRHYAYCQMLFKIFTCLSYYINWYVLFFQRNVNLTVNVPSTRLVSMRTVWILAAMVALLSVDVELSAPYNLIARNAPAQLVPRATHSSLVYLSSVSTTRIAPTTRLATA